MMFLAAGMSALAGMAAMLSTALTLVMGMLTSAVMICGTAILGVMILIFS